MSMLLLTGNVAHVLLTPTGTNREGVQYGGDYQVQIMGENVLQNDETRMELITVRTTNPEPFKKAIGKKIAVDVGVFVRNGSISYYMPKGSLPRTFSQSDAQ